MCLFYILMSLWPLVYVIFKYVIANSLFCICSYYTSFPLINLSYDRGGGLMCPPFFLFIFLLKISPLDQTLRPICKSLILGILGIFYHAIFFPENLVYKKFYYINSLNFLKLIRGGRKCPPPIFICENNRKSNKIMHCVEICF